MKARESEEPLWIIKYEGAEIEVAARGIEVTFGARSVVSVGEEAEEMKASVIRARALEPEDWGQKE